MNARALAIRAAPYGLLAMVAVAVTWPVLRSAGMPYNVDISVFFPLTPDAYEARFWPLWNERGGISTLQFLPALLLELPFLITGHLLAWDMALHVKVRILFGLIAAGWSMYALSRHLLERYTSGGPMESRWILQAAALTGALLFMLNPWSVHRVFHYFLWIGYVLAPLAILTFERLAERPGWGRALAFAAVCAIATTDPHNPPYLALLLAPFMLLRLVQISRRSLPDGARLVRDLSIAAGAYLLVSAFWILPYAYNALFNPGFGPTYVMSDQMLQTLGRNASLGDTLRLLHNYLPRAPLSPEGGPLLSLWTWASYAIPALAFAALLLVRRGAVLVIGGIAVACVILGTGGNPPFAGLYHWLLFTAPWGEGLGWLFRDPYRWGGFQALAYAALIPFALVELPRRIARLAPSLAPRRGTRGATTPALAIGAVLLFVGPAIGGYFGSVYEPVEIPSEYAEANAYLQTLDVDEKVVWMPRMLGATTWSGQRTLSSFDALSSARPSLGPFRPHTSTYFNFLQDAARDGAQIGPLLARAGVSDVVFHNDRDPARDAELLMQLERGGLPRTGTFGQTPTTRVDQASGAAAHTPASRLAIYGDRELVQSFTPTGAQPVALTLRARTVGEPPALQADLVDGAGVVVATRRASAAPAADEVRFSFSGIALVPGANYMFRVGIGGSPEAAKDDRYEVSYYKVDTYPPGEVALATTSTPWRALSGDASFELLTAAEGFVTILQNPEPAPRLRASSLRVASPGGLQMLRSVTTLPEGAPLAAAPIVFTGSGPSARTALAEDPRGWRWLASLDTSTTETLVPFIPEDAIIAPFGLTTNADSKLGWARGTTEFSYYEWGWPISLRALGQEDWQGDGGLGLVYTSANATLEVPIPSNTQTGVLLARVWMHPKGGPLAMNAPGLAVNVSTRAQVPEWQWINVGRLAAGAERLNITNHGAFQGVNALVVLSSDAHAEASAARDDAFRNMPISLISQAEVLPELAKDLVALPDIGRLARLPQEAALRFETPIPGAFALWMRVANGTGPPAALIDGHALDAAECAADCDGPAPWFAVDMGETAAGPHVLTIQGHASRAETPLLDAIAVTNHPADILPATLRAPPLKWDRLDATQFSVTLDGPTHLVLTDPYDPGWVARISGTGERIRAVPVDGLANGFFIDAVGPVTVVVVYEPQLWAERGVLVAASSVLVLLACVGFALARATRAPRTFGRISEAR